MATTGITFQEAQDAETVVNLFWNIIISKVFVSTVIRLLQVNVVSILVRAY